ncbi:DcaP family trimeric outer membrane transporter [Marinobacter caseinilyticus]|uniref:DcaP family trimeric outer membrane transporter n=1 Tax=Marinobacter caseinilyticus TaxID=2692195 RepID=UPI001F3EB496|nr:DcaP family trimeric outer membrane transporter [Marinobacter caseinilyticus]
MTRTALSFVPRPLTRAVALASLPLLSLGATAVSAQDVDLQELRQQVQQLEAKLNEMEARAPALQEDNSYLLKDGNGVKIGDTTISISGFIKADAKVGSHGNGSKNAYAIGIPRNLATFAANDTSDWKTGFSARETRLGIGTKTVDVAGHDLTTYIEMDFNTGIDESGNEVVSNSYNPRLRQAYGSWNGWDFGQTYTTFTDLAALPEILDQGKQAAFIYTRQPLIRYNMAAPGGKFMVSLENPEDGFGPVSYDDQSYPDLAARYQLRNEFGIYSLAGIVRSLEDDTADETTVTGAVSLSARIPTIGKDDLRLQYSYGALGRYMGLLSYPDFDRTELAAGKVEPLKTFGATAAYRHFWSPQWRSTLSVSYTEIADDIASAASTLSYFDNSTSVHANLLWSPHRKLTLGLEYAYWDFGVIGSSSSNQYEQVMASAKLGF